MADTGDGSEERDWRAMMRELLSLEINTVVKAGITTEKMPALPHALLDIAQEYGAVLLDSGVDVAAWLIAPGEEGSYPDFHDVDPDGDGSSLATRLAAATASTDPTVQAMLAAEQTRAGGVTAELRRVLSAEVLATPTTFRRLRRAARKRQGGVVEPYQQLMSHEPPEIGQNLLLERIINNCDTIVGILEDRLHPRAPTDRAPALALARDLARPRRALRRPFGPYMLPVDDVLTIRKFWEIGCEEVQAQTVVSLTGDVVTRVVPRMTRPEAASTVALHRQAIDVSLACWKGLAEAAAAVLDMIAKRLS